MTEPTVNSQIKDAVQTSTNWALGFAPLEQGTPSTSTRGSAGGAIPPHRGAPRPDARRGRGGGLVPALLTT